MRIVSRLCYDNIGKQDEIKGAKKMMKTFLSLLSLAVLGGCTHEANVSQERSDQQQDTTVVEEIENEESLQKENETEVVIEPVILEQPMWNLNSDEEYILKMEVGSIIIEDGFGILPVKLDTDGEVTTTFKSLFDIGVFTGEGISSAQGYDIRLIDSEKMTVAHPAVLKEEEYVTKAVQTFLGDGSSEGNQTIGPDHGPIEYFVAFEAPESD